MTIAVCFGQFGPYHHARVAALQRVAHEQGARVVPVQIAESTVTYGWEAVQETAGLKDQEPESAEADGDSVRSPRRPRANGKRKDGRSAEA